MGEIQRYKELVGRRVAEDDLEGLAVDLLKAAVASHGNWTGLWDGVLDRVRRLPPEGRSRVADGLVAQYHSEQDVRDALAIPPDVPVVPCDARNRESTKQVLISLVEYVLSMRRLRAGIPA